MANITQVVAARSTVRPIKAHLNEAMRAHLESIVRQYRNSLEREGIANYGELELTEICLKELEQAGT